MILSLETSTNVCSVAIHEIENGHLINHLESHLDKAHSAWLTLLIEQAVKFSGRNMQDIQAVAVSAGPGSYTGLRIGVSVAKGICYGLEIPLLSVNPLEAMTHEVTAYFTDSRFVYCPMLDARRMEVYTACYTHTRQPLKSTHPLIITEKVFDEYLQAGKKIAIFGNGAAKCRPLFATDDFLFLTHVYPSAKWLGKLAVEKFNQRQFENLAYFEPDYLKDFMATIPKKKL